MKKAKDLNVRKDRSFSHRSRRAPVEALLTSTYDYVIHLVWIIVRIFVLSPLYITHDWLFVIEKLSDLPASRMRAPWVSHSFNAVLNLLISTIIYGTWICEFYFSGILQNLRKSTCLYAEQFRSVHNFLAFTARSLAWLQISDPPLAFGIWHSLIKQ